jgi:hypothetical protein
VKDKKLLLVGISLILLPFTLVIFGGDRFRYPCQDPENWTKPICQKPACDVTRTCVEHVFKGQRDPRLGPPEEAQNILAKQQLNMVNAAPTCPPVQQGENCAK